MLCDDCKKREASVKIVQIISGEKHEQHLCEECARKQNELALNLAENMGFSIPNLLSSLLNYNTMASAPLRSTVPKTKSCSSCNLTLARFSQMGRFGCSNCYEEFKDQLKPLLKRIHGSVKHSGKIPQRRGKNSQLKRQIDEWRERLQISIAEERFEDAAELRDKIRELEEQVKGEEGNE